MKIKSKVVKIWINNKLVYLKKDGNSYRTIKPVFLDGKINWFNLITGGSWKSLIITTAITLIVLGVLYEYSHNIQVLLDCFKDAYQLELCKQSFGTNMTSIIVP